MPDRNPPDPGGPLRRVTSTAVVITFALVMTACVLGVVVWKALEAKATALARGRTDIQNLAHSLAEHASHTIQAADIAMAGMVDLLKYRDPLPDRFNRYLAETVEHAAAVARDRRARCRRQLAVFVACRKHRAQQFRPKLLHLSSRHTGEGAPHQRAVAVTPDRTIHDHSLEAHRQTGRQFRRRRHRSDRQRLLQRLLPDLPARSGRRHQPVTERRHRSDPLAAVGHEHESFQDRSVFKAPQAEFGRILQDHLPVRRHREVFRLRGNAALPDGRHRGDVGRLAAVRLGEDAAHRRHRRRRAAVHDPACWPRCSPCSSASA